MALVNVVVAVVVGAIFNGQITGGIAVVRGVYRESNLADSDVVFGLGGRAVLTIAIRIPVDLYSYSNLLGLQIMQEHAVLNGMHIYQFVL